MTFHKEIGRGEAGLGPALSQAERNKFKDAILQKPQIALLSTEVYMMDHFWEVSIQHQFATALAMLRDAIQRCPDKLWDDRTHGTPFWHIAYHTLFCTDFYLEEAHDKFKPRDFHEIRSQTLPGRYDWLDVKEVDTPAQPYARKQLFDYADHCRDKCDQVFSTLSEADASQRCGFPWYDLNQGQFLLNNLRHIQHHTGQLALILRRNADVGLPWKGKL
jgi:hypothetical protein